MLLAAEFTGGLLYGAVARPRQTDKSRTEQRGRHFQQDRSLVILTSPFLVFMDETGYLLHGPLRAVHSTDRLHNGRSFCYLFLKLSLKPVFTAAPVGSSFECSTLAEICQVSGFLGATGVQKNSKSTSTDTSASGPVLVRCSALKSLNILRGSYSHVRPAESYF